MTGEPRCYMSYSPESKSLSSTAGRFSLTKTIRSSTLRKINFIKEIHYCREKAFLKRVRKFKYSTNLAFFETNLSFGPQISDAREKEVEFLKKDFLWSTINWSILTFSPMIFQIISVATYIFFSTADLDVLDAGKVFVSIELFNIIDYPFWVFVLII